MVGRDARWIQPTDANGAAGPNAGAPHCDDLSAKTIILPETEAYYRRVVDADE
jgi:hypothetical protein